MVEEGGHCTDPGAYTAALVAHALAQGATHLRARATGFAIEGGRLRAVRTDGAEVSADAAVIAAGAFAKPLAAAAGDRVPLETERGYHAEVTDPEVAPRHGLMPSDGKMSIMRTTNGLRCAGQVEIAGLDAAPNWKRAEILRDHLLRCFPGLPRDLPAERVTIWLGHRPSMPDGKPCLGPSSASRDVVHAFGHGHTGLVAGARTGRVVAALLAGRPPEIPIAAFNPGRFA
jgi:D-amino-acid dehydrogenase